MAKEQEKTKKEAEIKKDDEVKKESEPKFKGKFISAIGKRKTAVASVRLFKNGKGAFVVNDQKMSKFFSSDKINIIQRPLKLTGLLRDIDLSVLVKGGGKKSQSEAIRHGISRALVEFNKDLKLSLKAKGFLTRDARKKERKKPGLKKARKSPQWSKR
jgi:small subunit ribosomal protein S9